MTGTFVQKYIRGIFIQLAACFYSTWQSSDGTVISIWSCQGCDTRMPQPSLESRGTVVQDTCSWRNFPVWLGLLYRVQVSAVAHVAVSSMAKHAIGVPIFVGKMLHMQQILQMHSMPSSCPSVPNKSRNTFNWSEPIQWYPCLSSAKLPLDMATIRLDRYFASVKLTAELLIFRTLCLYIIPLCHLLYFSYRTRQMDHVTHRTLHGWISIREIYLTKPCGLAETSILECWFTWNMSFIICLHGATNWSQAITKANTWLPSSALWNGSLLCRSKASVECLPTLKTCNNRIFLLMPSGDCGLLRVADAERAQVALLVPRHGVQLLSL